MPLGGGAHELQRAPVGGPGRRQPAEASLQLRTGGVEVVVAVEVLRGDLGLDEVGPEATRAVIDREIPGIGEAIRSVSRPHTPNWMLSRGLGGVRGSTLIVNFPGSPASIEQIGAELLPAIEHALALIAGRQRQH